MEEDSNYYQSDYDILYPSEEWINDTWYDIMANGVTDEEYVKTMLDRSFLNPSFDVWEILYNLYRDRSYQVFNTVLEYLEENIPEVRFTTYLVGLWRFFWIKGDAHPSFLRKFLEVVIACVPDGYNIVYNYVPHDPEELREYLKVLEECNIIPKTDGEKLWLKNLLKQNPFIVKEFIDKYNIEIMFDYIDISDVIDRLQTRKMSVVEFSTLMEFADFEPEEDTFNSFHDSFYSHVYYLSYNNEDILSHIVFRSMELYGRPPSPEECVTHEDLDSFKNSIESGDTEGMRVFFNKIAPYKVDKYVLASSIIPQVHEVIKRDDIETFKFLIEFITFEIFYLRFNIDNYLLVTNNSYKISKYLLENWRASKFSVTFFSDAVLVAIQYNDYEFIKLVSNYEDLFRRIIKERESIRQFIEERFFRRK